MTMLKWDCSADIFRNFMQCSLYPEDIVLCTVPDAKFEIVQTWLTLIKFSNPSCIWVNGR